MKSATLAPSESARAGRKTSGGQTPPEESLLTASYREWMNIKTDLVWVYDGEVPPQFRSGFWKSNHLSAWLLRRGSLVLKQEHAEFTVQAGQWVIPSPAGRQQDFSDDAHILSIRLRCAWPDGELLFPFGINHAFDEEDYPDLSAASENLVRTVKPYPYSDQISFEETPLRFAQYAALKAVLWQWIASFYEALVREGATPARVAIKDVRIERALAALHALPLSTPFREADLAAKVGLGLSQFVRLFRSEIGITPKRYFDRARFDFARRMVASDAVTIKEVAIELGFLRLSDFTRWFKIHCGFSPRAYRRKLKTLEGI